MTSCLELKQEIVNSDSAAPVAQLTGGTAEERIFDRERQLSSMERPGRIRLTVIGLGVFAIVALGLWMFGGNLGEAISSLFGVEGILTYIILGLAGALVFFVTEAFTKKENLLSDSVTTARGMTARIVLGTIIPIVLAVVFVSVGEDGKPKLGSGDPVALMCFAVGYSSKLVVMLLNKIVQKGESIINAI